jgi:hypothetical protein
MESRQITIIPRFRGPTNSGNGGYVCGRLAQHLQGPAIVRLAKPPPLNTAMDVRDSERNTNSGPAIELWAGDDMVASAWLGDLSLEVPAPPTPEEVELTRPMHMDPEYRYPKGCFVCGPERDFGDGMRVFPGPVEGRCMVAGTWLPDESLADESDLVAPHFVWSALDCPGGLSSPPRPGHTALLGQFAAQQLAPIKTKEKYTVIGWGMDHQGRKRLTGSAIFDSADRCVGKALGTWIEVPLPG